MLVSILKIHEFKSHQPKYFFFLLIKQILTNQAPFEDGQSSLILSLKKFFSLKT